MLVSIKNNTRMVDGRATTPRKCKSWTKTATRKKSEKRDADGRVSVTLGGSLACGVYERGILSELGESDNTTKWGFRKSLCLVKKISMILNICGRSLLSKVEEQNNQSFRLR